MTTEYCNFQELVSSLAEVISNKHGKKVLLYLLSPRDPAHLLPEIVQLLEKGDGNAHRSALLTHTNTHTPNLSAPAYVMVPYYFIFFCIIDSI